MQRQTRTTRRAPTRYDPTKYKTSTIKIKNGGIRKKPPSKLKPPPTTTTTYTYNAANDTPDDSIALFIDNMHDFDSTRGQEAKQYLGLVGSVDRSEIYTKLYEALTGDKTTYFKNLNQKTDVLPPGTSTGQSLSRYVVGMVESMRSELGQTALGPKMTAPVKTPKFQFKAVSARDVSISYFDALKTHMLWTRLFKITFQVKQML